MASREVVDYQRHLRKATHTTAVDVFQWRMSMQTTVEREEIQVAENLKIGWNTLDRAQLRADTPGCGNRVHLNNAGSSLPPACVTAAVIEYLRLEEQIGGYEAVDETQEAYAKGRQDIAQFFGAEPRNLALVESSTVGLHRILSAIQLRAGDRVLVSNAEYAATMLPLLQLAGRVGIRIEVVPDGPDGTTDPMALVRLLDEDVKAVFAVHAPSHNGLVNDVGEIGRLLKEHDSQAWYVVDACQSAGQLPVSAAGFQADFLYASGRKYLRGPRGTGVLLVADRALEALDAFPVDVYGGAWSGPATYSIAADATRFETYERSYASVFGLIEAVRYAAAIGIVPLSAAVRRNAEYLRSKIGIRSGWEVLDRGRTRSGIVTIRHETVSAQQAKEQLTQAGISVSLVKPATNPRDLGTLAAVRISPHAFNNCSELDAVLAALPSTVPQARRG
ncbi:MAG: aminotransferase class V-fold PLP-dependent enzyme [Actinomycetia bacterium]|nr:aminotransferase class V-fold PLP-dependent enzyme [Actinomycetes bacterium]